MKFEPEIWKKMAQRCVKAFEVEILPPARSLGFKIPKGEVKFPESLVKELIAQAFISGARAALKMAEAVDAAEAVEMEESLTDYVDEIKGR